MVTEEFRKIMARINVEGGPRYYLDTSSAEALLASLRRHFGGVPMGYAEVWRDERGYYVGGQSPSQTRPATSVVSLLMGLREG